MAACSSSTPSSRVSSSGRDGRLERAARRPALRWAPLIALGMAVQLLLFSTPARRALGPLAPAYVASNLAVLAAVWRNIRSGSAARPARRASNLIAIVANGGYMPVSADALVAMGRPRARGTPTTAWPMGSSSGR